MESTLQVLCVGCALLAVVCQIWLILMIVRGNPALILMWALSLFIPCFTFLFTVYYAANNWDIAKVPFLLYIGGLFGAALFGILGSGY